MKDIATARPPTTKRKNEDTAWEMGAYQRGLVDSCFEEGQYDTAIALLEQLRSSEYKPAISHIEQLIYISLHTVSEGQDNDNYVVSPSSSPSKLVKQHKLPLLSSKTITAARQILMSFAFTNSPQSLAQVLPCYHDPNNSDLASASSQADSIFARYAQCIGEAKHCWCILQEDFLLQTKNELSPVKRKRTAKSRQLEKPEPNSFPDLNHGLAMVGDNAWSVLDWIITLFERDELTMEALGHSRHSPLLAQQLPSSRDGDGAKWDTTIPVNVVFHCFEQQDHKRQVLGRRLLTLLINLSSTVLLNFSMFVGTVFGHLSTSSPTTFSFLFSILSPLPNILMFKVALCQRIINDSVLRKQTQVAVRPRPMARAQPRAFLNAQGFNHQSRENLTTNPRNIEATESSNMLRLALPSWDEIKISMEADITQSISPPAMKSLLLRTKFELVFSYGTLLSQRDSKEEDKEWVAFKNQNITDAISTSFVDEGPDGALFITLLQAAVSNWASSDEQE